MNELILTLVKNKFEIVFLFHRALKRIHRLELKCGYTSLDYADWFSDFLNNNIEKTKKENIEDTLDEQNK